MKNHLDKLEAIYRMNESILTILDMNALLNKILEIMESTFGFDTSAILLYDDKSKDLYIGAAVGYKDEMIKNFRTSVGGKGITGYVARHKKPLFIPNISADDRYISGVEGAKSEIAIPLLVKDQFIGVLDVESKREYTFSEDDFEVMRLFASHLALAIHNAMIFESERKKTSQLLVINEIRKKLSLSLDLDKLLDIVARSIMEFFGHHHIFIFIILEDKGGLKMMTQAGLGKMHIRKDFSPTSEDHIIGWAFAKNQTISVNDIHISPFKKTVLDHAQSELAIPISIQQTPIGILYLAGTGAEAYDEKDIHILEVIAEQLSLIINDAVTYTEINKKSKHMEIIHKIGKVAIQRFDLRQFIDDITRLIYDIFGFYQVAILTYEKISQQLELASYAGENMETVKIGDKFSSNEGIIGHVVRTGKFYLCNDTSKESHYRDVLVRTKSELTLPIKCNDQILGIMNIESMKLNQFEDTDVEIFTKIAEQIAYTMMNAELFKQKSSAHTLLLNLNSLSREINSTFALNNILATIIRKLPNYVNCRLCSLFFYYPAKNQMRLMAHNFPEVKGKEPISLNVSDNVLMTRVIQLNHSIHVTDIENELNIPSQPQYETKSFLNILIRHQERIIGVLNLTDKLDHRPFSPEEFYLINSFSEHLATAFINSEKYQKILDLSITDGLTGLYVHRHFQDTLDHEIARARRYKAPLSLILLDLDDFKRFNDQYGHQIGDIVLREVALVIRKKIRKSDIAFRYGGEEFGVILPATPLDQAGIFAKRLIDRIANHRIMFGKKELSVTASSGLCEFEHHMSKNEFIEHADRAMLRAKVEGKNRVVTYTGHDSGGFDPGRI